jgi:hypothetical protein
MERANIAPLKTSVVVNFFFNSSKALWHLSIQLNSTFFVSKKSRGDAKKFSTKCL